MQPGADIAVVLMAGGFGRRLGDITRNLPKPLVPVGDKPIIQRIIEGYVAHDLRRFVITLHHLAHRIEAFCGRGDRFGAEIAYLYESEPRGTVGGISALRGKVRAPVIVSNCDLLAQVEPRRLLAFHKGSGADLTVCTVDHEVRVEFGVLRMSGDRIAAVDEKPLLRFPIASGIYVLQPRAIELIPEAGSFDMPDLIRAAIAAGLRVNGFANEGEWIDIGRVHDLERANRRVAMAEAGGTGLPPLQRTA